MTSKHRAKIFGLVCCSALAWTATTQAQVLGSSVGGGVGGSLGGGISSGLGNFGGSGQVSASGSLGTGIRAESTRRQVRQQAADIAGGARTAATRVAADARTTADQASLAAQSTASAATATTLAAADAGASQASSVADAGSGSANGAIAAASLDATVSGAVAVDTTTPATGPGSMSGSLQQTSWTAGSLATESVASPAKYEGEGTFDEAKEGTAAPQKESSARAEGSHNGSASVQ